MRYLRAFIHSMIFVALLTAAQYGSVHLLTRRPVSWLFELSLDLAPPLLFAGDVAQATYTHASQAPLREQVPALALGFAVNLLVYGATATLVTGVFFPRRRSSNEFTAGRRTR